MHAAAALVLPGCQLVHRAAISSANRALRLLPDGYRWQPCKSPHLDVTAAPLPETPQ